MNHLSLRRFGLLLASIAIPATLVAAGCGGAGDGSRPASNKINEPATVGDLRFSDVAPGTLFDVTPLLNIRSFAPATLTTTRGAANQTLALSLGADSDPVSTNIAFSLGSSETGGALAPFAGGQRLNFPRAGSNVEISQSNGTGDPRRFRATGGTVIVRGLSAPNAEIELDNVRFEPTAPGSGVGSFALSGIVRSRAVNVIG